MAINPSDLRAIPLFQDISDTHLLALTSAFDRKALAAGDVLFRAGDEPQELVLLVSGEVVLKEGDDVRFRLRPPAPIGELGAITGLERYTTAEASEASELWTITTEKLMRFFEANGDVAFPFYHNLVRVVADKVRRDERRLQEMRANIVRTQKAMKRIRDLVLETEDTKLSKPVFETLEDLIERNRKGHYLVEPAHTLVASVRLDNGTTVAVRGLSDAWLKLAPAPGDTPKKSADWSGVLVLPQAEIPVCGRVNAVDPSGVLVKLDLLIDDYDVQLKDYLTRLHMLDFVV